VLTTARATIGPIAEWAEDRYGKTKLGMDHLIQTKAHERIRRCALRSATFRRNFARGYGILLSMRRTL
jgi:hypothetical protein